VLLWWTASLAELTNVSNAWLVQQQQQHLSQPDLVIDGCCTVFDMLHARFAFLSLTKLTA
jgi:hypothetical protein